MLKKKITLDLALATSSQFAQKLVGYAVIMLMARHLDKSEMGQFFYAAAVTTVLCAITDLGTSRYLMQRVAERRDEALQYLSDVVSLRLPVLVVSFGLLNILVAMVQPALLKVMLLTSLYQLFSTFALSFVGLLNGLRHIGSRVAAESLGQALLAALVVSALAAGAGLTAVLTGYIVAHLAALAAAIALVRRQVGRFGLAWHGERLRAMLRRSLPLFLLGVLTTLLFKMDTMMIGILASARVVATYEAGFKLFEVSQMLMRPAVTIVFPLFVQLAYGHRWREFSRYYALFLGANVGIGIAVTAVVWVLAGWVMNLVFGAQYADSVGVLRILYIAVPALYVAVAASFLAAALGVEKVSVVIMAVVIAAKAAAIPLLLARGGIEAVAWTTVAACVAIAAGNVVAAARAVAWRRGQWPDGPAAGVVTAAIAQPPRH